MAGPWEDYAPAAAPAKTAPAPWEEYAASAPVDKFKDFSLQGPEWERVKNYSGRDAVGGQIRGAGSLGASAIRPFESAAENEQRRESMDAALTQLVGSDPNSTGYKTNKLIAEVAGTSGIGGGIAGGLAKIPGVAKAFPSLLSAIQTGGMTAGSATGASGLATRAVGGAINGAATASLVNPQDASVGAAFGAATPIAAKAAGAVGQWLGKPGPSIGPNATTLATAKEGMDAGYILPPATLKPTAMNRAVEAFSGKDATKQLVSMRNTEVTEKLVRQSLGLADDVPLTISTMENLRKTAGKTYAEVSALSPQAGADLEALKSARNKSQAWFKSYNASKNPDHLATAKEFGATANALEASLEQHAQAAMRPELVPDLREARKQIAKTYTVGRALNDATGTVDARVLGRMHDKGMPLSDGLDVAGKFASAFPTATKTPMQIGSPAVSKLAAVGSGLLGSGGFAAMGPAGIAAATLPFVVPPMVRARMFSDSVQKGLLNSPKGSGAVRGLLSDAETEMLPLLYRSSGLLGGGR